MPSYNYECDSCKSVMKIIQGMNDLALKKHKCGVCNKEQKVRRIISGGSGMIFKGSGFYLTDYTEYGKKNKKVKKDKVTSKPEKKKDKKKKD